MRLEHAYEVHEEVLRSGLIATTTTLDGTDTPCFEALGIRLEELLAIDPPSTGADRLTKR